MPICSLASGLSSSFVSKTSRNETMAISEFGTSIPMADFPGIGASIRISFAAMLMLNHPDKLTILLTFTPTSG